MTFKLMKTNLFLSFFLSFHIIENINKINMVMKSIHKTRIGGGKVNELQLCFKAFKTLFMKWVGCGGASLHVGWCSVVSTQPFYNLLILNFNISNYNVIKSFSHIFSIFLSFNNLIICQLGIYNQIFSLYCFLFILSNIEFMTHSTYLKLGNSHKQKKIVVSLIMIE